MCVYSGMICKNAIAKKTPPLNALAIPSTIGDSLKLDDLIGMTPKRAASRKAIMIKPILIAKTDSILNIKYIYIFKILSNHLLL